MDVLQLNDYRKVVAIGGGHGLGRVLSSLSFLGHRLTGIVATTDNGGSTGRLRDQHNCIAWGDLRNCISQLADRPSVGSLLFEYRFDGNSDLSGHNLGNLVLYALDQLCVRPLDAVNLIRSMLKIECKLIPMSEVPTHLMAQEQNGNWVFGELNVDRMQQNPKALGLEPMVEPTQEAISALLDAELIVLGPGSFLTSTLPALLMPKVAEAIRRSSAKVLLIENLTPETSAAANRLSAEERVDWCNRLIGKQAISRVLCHAETSFDDGIFSYLPLRSAHHQGLHCTQALASAIMATPLHTRLIA
ncbi:uridine diphosphate-N-acetylglucosamine-binding protein YvcK [Shewanella sp. JM162201]|uniref:Putative gluconeogenesis factor n=1 Tax=Shewanella jiangmenensis TaxID=2837387 RepID=A0ABS5V655_9GAMM|nr:uridine diphosphate-N-acetylglucosamine-binding protein YvcK [Shewanella jiangmenensis]MBT1445920.1 uridine diphosphate-N-acetylglucosamine-binding protein YvcK [Shewanella jiangmenensis]